jgi:cysteine desulfurase
VSERPKHSGPERLGPDKPDPEAAGPEHRAELVVDALGRRCPVPVIELARRIGDVPLGGVVAVLADDAAAALDIPAWCDLRGQQYLGAEGTTYRVRRTT